MKRSYIICLIALVFFSFGYRLQTHSRGGISKIYLDGSVLVRTTPYEDIRLYDISNPTAPNVVGTIAIQGNHDVAVKGDYLYADSYQDLLVFDIANPSRPVVIDTIRQVFNMYDFGNFNDFGGRPIQVDGFNSGEVGGIHGCAGNGCADRSVSANSSGSTIDTLLKQSTGDYPGNGGKAGSMARFAIVENFLYCINDISMTVYDISDPSRPQYKNAVNVGWDIETLFPHKNYLFMGGRQGMYVYNIADRTNPTYYSEFTHARSCDPVVVEGDRAYVTLRSGSPCGDTEDQLGVIDIGDVRNPRSLRTVAMTNPYGLSVKEKIVTVCDGSGGLAIVNTSDPNNIRKVGSIGGITPYDAIQEGNLLVVTAETGFYLYDVADPARPKLYSQFE
jgi:hypothetical protein